MEERRKKRRNMEKKGEARRNKMSALMQEEHKSEAKDGGEDASFQPEDEAEPEEEDEEAFAAAFPVNLPEPEPEVPEYIQAQAATGQGFNVTDTTFGDLIWSRDQAAPIPQTMYRSLFLTGLALAKMVMMMEQAAGVIPGQALMEVMGCMALGFSTTNVFRPTANLDPPS